MLGLITISAHAIGNSSDNITIPNTFSSGITISSSQMNENFNELVKEITRLNNKIDLLQNKLLEDSLILFNTTDKYYGTDFSGGRNNVDSICSNDPRNTDTLRI